MKRERFIDNGNGTVTDNSTGLCWLKDVKDYNDDKVQNWNDAVNGCKKFKFAGHNDWRLPTFQELFSIVDEARYNPSIDTKYFKNTGPNGYWTSTVEYDDYTNEVDVVFVFFCGGYMDYCEKNAVLRVRPVRGGM